jgi:hypothetical protein
MSVFARAGAATAGMTLLARRLLRAGAATAVVVLVVGGGIGWLYLLRRTSGLAAGPRLAGALPLERLAGHGTQPLARVLAAWVPAALAAAFALAAVTRLPAPARAAVAGLGSFALLLALGALSDATTASDPIGSHVGSQLDRGATWLVAAVFGACAPLIPRRRAPRPAEPARGSAATPAPDPAATRSDAPAPAAGRRRPRPA